MKHVTIIIHPAQINLSSIVGIQEVFAKANQYWKKQGRKEPLTIELAGTSKKADFANGRFIVKPDRHISSLKKTDLIIIPSCNPRYRKTDKR